MHKRLVALAAAFGAAVTPAYVAAADPVASDGPVKLTDSQLDEVVAGDHGPSPFAFALAAEHARHHGQGGLSLTNGQQPLSVEQVNFIIKDVRLTFNIVNSNVNLAAVLQLALSGNPIQSGTASAFQVGG
jgi:hypothetical protein